MIRDDGYLNAPANMLWLAVSTQACLKIIGGAASANGLVAIDVDGHQQAETEQQGHHRRTAVGDQRQRNADHRYQSHNHGDIDENVEEKCRPTARSDCGN